jgi:membrane-associated protein
MHSAVPVLATATQDRPLAYVVLFLAVALSWAGVPAIGAAAMGAAGVLSSQSELHLWLVLVVAVVGAEVGGLAGWRIGHRVVHAGHDRRRGPSRAAERATRALDAGERVERRWGRMMVFFVPAYVSGALAMPLRQFALWNAVAASMWVIAAGFGAYGVGSAASGGSLLDTLLPLVIAALAFALIALAFVHWRRQRRPRDIAPPG